MRDPAVVVEGFERPEIVVSVERFADADAKDRALVERAAERAAPRHTGIVYVGTRRRAEELADAIAATGTTAAAYHAGLARSRRDQVHDAFLDGSVRVVVATTAFGMGIDKPDVRFVLHADVPETVDAWYQQIGRAGRDGADAQAILYYRPEDLARNRFRSGGTAAADRAVTALATLDAAGGALDRQAIADEADLSPWAVTQAVHLLEDAGLVVPSPDDPVRLVPGRAGVDTEEAVGLLTAAEEARGVLEATRVEMVRALAESRGCRWRFVLTYLGQTDAVDCGRCDRCTARGGRDDEDRDEHRSAGSSCPASPSPTPSGGPGTSSTSPATRSPCCSNATATGRSRSTSCSTGACCARRQPSRRRRSPAADLGTGRPRPARASPRFTPTGRCRRGCGAVRWRGSDKGAPWRCTRSSSKT